MVVILRHNNRMRPYGTSIQLQKRRQQAQELLDKGRTVEQAARQVGVTARSLYRWRQAEKHRRRKVKNGQENLLIYPSNKSSGLKKNFCEVHMPTDIVKITGLWIALDM